MTPKGSPVTSEEQARWLVSEVMHAEDEFDVCKRAAAENPAIGTGPFLCCYWRKDFRDDPCSECKMAYERIVNRALSALRTREAETWEQAAQERKADRIVLEQAHALINKESIDRLHYARPDTRSLHWLDWMKRRSALLQAIEERLRARAAQPQEPEKV